MSLKGLTMIAPKLSALIVVTTAGVRGTGPDRSSRPVLQPRQFARKNRDFRRIGAGGRTHDPRSG